MAGTANVKLSTQVVASTFARMHAGGIWETGPFNVASPPMTFDLLFVNTDPLDANTAHCCVASDKSCCSADGVVAHGVSALVSGSELGSHAVKVSDTKASFTLDGSFTITKFLQLF